MTETHYCFATQTRRDGTSCRDCRGAVGTCGPDLRPLDEDCDFCEAAAGCPCLGTAESTFHHERLRRAAETREVRDEERQERSRDARDRR